MEVSSEWVENTSKLQDWVDEHEVTFDIHEAIFLMDDGTLIEGEFDMGVRGLDHNCIISLAPDELSHSDKWSYIHDTFKVVRLVPETNIALVNQGQILTAAQIEALELSSYEVEEY